MTYQTLLNRLKEYVISLAYSFFLFLSKNYDGVTMNKYTNPRSKRKQKAKAKRQAKEMCNTFMLYPSAALQGSFAQTPDEFIRAERNEPLSRTETGELPKVRKLKPSKGSASGKEKANEQGKVPCNRNASEMNQVYRYA